MVRQHESLRVGLKEGKTEGIDETPKMLGMLGEFGKHSESAMLSSKCLEVSVLKHIRVVILL